MRPRLTSIGIACLLFVCVLPARPASDDFTGFDLLELLADKSKREEGLATVRADADWIPLLLDAYERDSPQGDSEERTRALREGVLAALRIRPGESHRALSDLSADADKERRELAFSLIQALGPDAAPMTKELAARASKERSGESKAAILKTVGIIGAGRPEIRSLFEDLLLRLDSPDFNEQVRAARLIPELGPALKPFANRLAGRLTQDPRISRPLADAMLSSGDLDSIQKASFFQSTQHSMIGFAYIYGKRLAVHNFDERRLSFFKIPTGFRLLAESGYGDVRDVLAEDLGGQHPMFFCREEDVDEVSPSQESVGKVACNKGIKLFRCRKAHWAQNEKELKFEGPLSVLPFARVKLGGPHLLVATELYASNHNTARDGVKKPFYGVVNMDGVVVFQPDIRHQPPDNVLTALGMGGDGNSAAFGIGRFVETEGGEGPHLIAARVR